MKEENTMIPLEISKVLNFLKKKMKIVFLSYKGSILDLPAGYK